MSTYERDFRTALGFTNQAKLKSYFKATDFVVVNWERIEKCNERLKEICLKLNQAISSDIQVANIEEFTQKIDTAYSIMRNNDIFPRLNNQGRNPDDVYYNWMRGYLICEMFIPAIALIFCIPVDSVRHTGQDDLANIDTFARAATADLEIQTQDGRRVRIEMQAGYTGINDIKKSKLEEAKSRKNKDNIETYVIHFDVFNGKAAVLRISNAQIETLNFHSAFENTPVLSIKGDWFRWRLKESLQPLSELTVDI